jgi:sulfur-oxidizing protein SoxY
MTHNKSGLNRRQAVAALGLGSIVVTLLPIDASATAADANKLLSELVKGQPKAGKITIKTQEIAENGNTVPVTVTVESPMSANDYVKAIHVVSDGNPLPAVASFMLSPASGKAEVYFRMRMAATQNIIAVAEMSDGSSWSAAREVKVTIGGCGG